ncbi:MAG: hypothetical protein JSS65_11215 [Armatimonadetes bacterium]|nr:hypothetical protein [Armatimonadota bacterium]
MVTCVCGKSIEKVPDWLQAVEIQFVCTNCPNRTVKSIADVTLAPAVTAAGDTGAIESDLPEDEDDEDED